MNKPKILYRQVIEIWSDYPLEDQELDSLPDRTPDCYWVFRDVEVVGNQEEFPKCGFFNTEQ